MQEAREATGLSQSALARLMQEAGFASWSQTMVSRRERNESTLRWREGVALRGIIGYPTDPGDSAADRLTLADAQAFQRIADVVLARRELMLGGR